MLCIAMILNMFKLASFIILKHRMQNKGLKVTILNRIVRNKNKGLVNWTYCICSKTLQVLHIEAENV